MRMFASVPARAFLHRLVLVSPCIAFTEIKRQRLGPDPVSLLASSFFLARLLHVLSSPSIFSAFFPRNPPSTLKLYSRPVGFALSPGYGRKHDLE